jgi:hypothetical protein
VGWNCQREIGVIVEMPSRVSANRRAPSRSTDNGMDSGCCVATRATKSPTTWCLVIPAGGW